MSEKITDLVVPENVTSPEMVYSNKVYLSAQGNIPPQKKYISLLSFDISYNSAVCLGKRESDVCFFLGW